METLWGVRAGQRGEADDLFRIDNLVAIGWPEVGDLSELAADREQFRVAVQRSYLGSDVKPGAISVYAGMLFRFACEMKEGDIVVYPSKIERQIHIGRVVGPYMFSDSRNPAFPNRRKVRWDRSYPRSDFTLGAQAKTNSALTLFQVKNYADEFLAALAGNANAVDTASDVTVSKVEQETAQTTADFILTTLARDFKGKALEEFVAALLRAMGYRARLDPEGHTGGVDIVAHRDELGFEPPIIKVQVKSSEGSISRPLVSALCGHVAADREYGLFVTLGTFTQDTNTFARTKPNLRLVDGEALVALVLDYYDKLEAGVRARLPLARVYVPDAGLALES